MDNTNVDWDRESITYSISGANLPTWLGDQPDQPDQPRKKTKYVYALLKYISIKNSTYN